MGRWGARIGKYWMSFADYNLSKVRNRSRTRDYYKKKLVDLEFVVVAINGEERQEEEMRVPICKVVPIKYENGWYSLDWDKYNLTKVLWYELEKRKIEVQITPYAHVFKQTREREMIKYFLKTRIKDWVYISLTDSAIKIEPQKLTSYAEIEWLEKHGLRYDE